MSQWHLGITLRPTSSPLPHPQGTIARAAAPCQGCFLLLCSKSSATACSFKDFLLSGSPSGLALPGRHSPKPGSRPAGTLGPSAPLMLAGPMGFPPIQSPRACAGSTERASGTCPLPGCSGLCSMAHPRVAWKKLTLSYKSGTRQHCPIVRDKTPVQGLSLRLLGASGREQTVGGQTGGGGLRVRSQLRVGNRRKRKKKHRRSGHHTGAKAWTQEARRGGPTRTKRGT